MKHIYIHYEIKSRYVGAYILVYICIVIRFVIQITLAHRTINVFNRTIKTTRVWRIRRVHTLSHTRYYMLV